MMIDCKVTQVFYHSFITNWLQVYPEQTATAHVQSLKLQVSINTTLFIPSLLWLVVGHVLLLRLYIWSIHFVSRGILVCASLKTNWEIPDYAFVNDYSYARTV